jgi:RNA polymerase sigma-70 factor (ECF subfamily)
VGWNLVVSRFQIIILSLRKENTVEINFEAEFLLFKDELTSYLYRLSANKQDAQDLTHDTFLRSKQKINQFKGASSIKTWVFKIATNLAKDNQRVKQRWAINVQDDCKQASMTNPDLTLRITDSFLSQDSVSFDIKEHINYCFTCISKNLQLEHQIAIILKEVYQFKRAEIAKIIGRTEGSVKHLLFDGRKQLQEKYDSRCAMINKSGACYQCAELNDTLQGMAKGPSDAQQKIKAFDFRTNQPEFNLDVRLAIIQKINPLEGNGAALEDTILQILRETIQEV